MYLMNKVRKLSDKTLYEVVDFDINYPNRMTIQTLDKFGLEKILTAKEKDFCMRCSANNDCNKYLISMAEESSTKLFEVPEFVIATETSFFTLLWELVQKGAFFIPHSLFVQDRAYKGDEVSNFYNIRVSSSSMYLGFSLIHEGSWFSSKIMGIQDHEICVKPFYIALPIEQKLSMNFPVLTTAKINEKLCNIILYQGQLPVIPKFSPVAYFPLPLFNYLNLQYSRCVNAINFFSDIFETKGVMSSQRDYIVSGPERAILVESSIKNTSKIRRAQLWFYYDNFNGTLSEFSAVYKLNQIEYYIFSLLEGIKGRGSIGELSDLIRLLKIKRSMYSLVLMQLRVQLFKEPFIFPYNQETVIARGGGGGDSFFTRIIKNF